MGFAFHLFRRPCLSCWRFTPDNKSGNTGEKKKKKKCRHFPFCVDLGQLVGYIPNSLSLLSLLFVCVSLLFDVDCGKRPTRASRFCTKTKHTHTHDPSIHQCDERYSFPLFLLSFFLEIKTKQK
jgi:hypothetical protein